MITPAINFQLFEQDFLKVVSESWGTFLDPVDLNPDNVPDHASQHVVVTEPVVGANYGGNVPSGHRSQILLTTNKI